MEKPANPQVGGSNSLGHSCNLQIHLIGGYDEQGNGQGNTVGKTEGDTD